jgi:hypothetical protein
MAARRQVGLPASWRAERRLLNRQQESVHS